MKASSKRTTGEGLATDIACEEHPPTVAVTGIADSNSNEWLFDRTMWDEFELLATMTDSNSTCQTSSEHSSSELAVVSPAPVPLASHPIVMTSSAEDIVVDVIQGGISLWSCLLQAPRINSFLILITRTANCLSSITSPSTITDIKQYLTGLNVPMLLSFKLALQDWLHDLDPQALISIANRAKYLARIGDTGDAATLSASLCSPTLSPAPSMISPFHPMPPPAAPSPPAKSVARLHCQVSDSTHLEVAINHNDPPAPQTDRNGTTGGTTGLADITSRAVTSVAVCHIKLTMKHSLGNGNNEAATDEALAKRQRVLSFQMPSIHRTRSQRT
ncbi:hypothetical protein FRB95_010963 [Tulasnella sp. JGI-2019a]|nr:hypothetical protein FRB95_010963 [Tulasnella sp. JGI-2019a]